MSATATRRPAALVVLLASLLVGLTLPTTPAHAAVDAGAESQFVAAVNQARSAQGLPSLQVAGDLTSVARQHSARMADGDNLHHNPNLGSQVTNWQKVGENVGTGPSVDSIHSAFMNSASHRANILGSDWTQVGVGVEVRGDTIWVTQVFRQPQGASQPAPEPESTPAPQPAPEPESEPQSASDDAPASRDTAAADEGSTAEAPQPATVKALPVVAPEADRALAMMRRVAAEDADLDTLTD